MSPDLGERGHIHLFPPCQDLSTDGNVPLDRPSNVGSVIGPAIDQGDLGFRVDGEGKDERAVFLLQGTRYEVRG